MFFLCVFQIYQEVFESENEAQGWVSAESLLKYKPVKNATKLSKAVTLSGNFFMRNRDLFEIKIDGADKSRLLVRLRPKKDASEEPLDEEEELSFVDTIKVLLTFFNFLLLANNFYFWLIFIFYVKIISKIIEKIVL